MADSSAAFRTAEQLRGTGLALMKNRWAAENGQSWVPLYEAKMIHLYDHRWGTYDNNGESRDATLSEKQDPAFEPMPRYWVPECDVADRLATKAWTRGWLLGWRDITSAHVLRTTIATPYPAFAIGHTIRNLFVIDQPRLAAAFIAGLSSLTFDFIARQKLGGTHLTVEILKQLPVLSPSRYNYSDLNFIVPRVLALTYTSHSMAPFALRRRTLRLGRGPTRAPVCRTGRLVRTRLRPQPRRAALHPRSRGRERARLPVRNLPRAQEQRNPPLRRVPYGPPRPAGLGPLA
jgi:hypothetical protein